MITRSERLLTHSREYLRCWIRRPTAIIVFQKPLSKRWGLFLLSTQMSVATDHLGAFFRAQDNLKLAQDTEKHSSVFVQNRHFVNNGCEI